MRTNSAPSGDFNRNHKPATPDALVVQAATTYSRMTATGDETDAMLLRVYGPDRLPGTESRRRSNLGEGTSKQDRACAQCGESLSWRFRFCSQVCWGKWHEEHEQPPISGEMRAEMLASLDALRQEVIE